MGIAQLAHAADESILCREEWRRTCSQMTMGRTCYRCSRCCCCLVLSYRLSLALKTFIVYFFRIAIPRNARRKENKVRSFSRMLLTLTDGAQALNLHCK